MELRPLGRTGFSVTPIGLGLAALGRPGYINLKHAEDLNHQYGINTMRDNTAMVLSAAYESGVRYFDAARSYGKAEAFLADWLHAHKFRPRDVMIGSKWGYTYTANWQVDADIHEVKEHSLEVLHRQWQESRDHLNGYLNLYQVHSATLKSGILDNTAVLTQLANLKREGVAIGLSLSGAKQAETLHNALAIKVDGVRLFETVQATWNILEQSVGDALRTAHDEGLGVIIKEALANGRLTSKNDNPDFASHMAILTLQATRLNTSVDALALAAVLSQSWCDVVLSGAVTVAHLQSNLAALDVEWDEEASDTLLAFAEAPDVYWNRRSDLDWN